MNLAFKRINADTFLSAGTLSN